MEEAIRTVKRSELPERLLEIPGCPKHLYIRGSLPAPHTKMLGVVGSRALTPYGQKACETIIAGLKGYPISIVSGLALGTDACAHKAALEAGLHTVAVLPGGIDDASIYPRTNKGLADAILTHGGCLVSEQEEGYMARPYDFPKRNRIVAGLSEAVLIIEAGEKSGTLITARLAGEYNRDLLCIPHRIGDLHGFGAHLFLRLGAALVTEPLHVLEVLGIPPRKEPEVVMALEKEERTLYHLLQDPLSKEMLIKRSRLNTSVALSTLVKLELKGLIKEEFGLWQRCSRFDNI